MRYLLVFSKIQVFNLAAGFQHHFTTNIPYPNGFKVWILRTFGAKIGLKVVIKPWVK